MQVTQELFQQGALVGAGFILAMLLYYSIFRQTVVLRMEKKLRDRKDQFTGLASHYLLTPITIIQTAITRLQEADTTLTHDQRLQLYEAITLGQQRLWIIAEQMVLVNQIDFDEMQLQPKVVDVSETVSTAVSAVDIFARHKKVVLQYHDESEKVKEGRLDPRRMRQALIAVLDNAIKFSVEDTAIQVRLRTVADRFVVEIEDQGIGMPPDIMAKATQKFFRGSGIYNFDYEGLGLGLHIAHAIILQHQGSIHFESKPKRGTIVTIEFPSL